MSTVTPKAILSYPHLFVPQVFQEGQKPKYSCALVFEAGTDINELKRLALEAAKAKWGDKAEGMIRDGTCNLPFHNDGHEKKGYPEGSVYMNVRTTRKPGIVSVFPGPDGKPLPLNSEEEIYPGCIVKASVGAFAYDRQGNKGVSFGLNNLQKLADGERLDGRAPADEEFEADESAVAELPADDDEIFF